MNSILWTLFWAFVAAPIVWWLVWLLLHDSGTMPAETADTESDSSSSSSDASEEAEKEESESRSEPAQPVDEEKDESLPAIKTATADEAAARFHAEIESGTARLDDNYGVVYTAAPDDPDDLKKIKGVAKVLEGKLNGHGVYHFRQIAFWTDPAVKEFSKLLTSFKDRIYRDDWIAQAKELHEQKYGEKL